MSKAGELEQARIQGSLAAARELRRLKIDQSRSVDIFRIVTDANLWLLFQPMENLLGAYLRNHGGGILINSRRSRSVQRLTAAHEYGHHVLRHQGSLDDEDDIDDPWAGRQLEEAAAQAFAVDFLMPIQLVNKLWADLQMPDNVEAYHAYVLSLFMGASYRATVYQLATLEKISRYKATQLLRVTPKQVKQQIGRGIGPNDPWAELWPIDEARSGETLEIGVNDELRLSLAESPSTGYLWTHDQSRVIDLRATASTPARQEEGIGEQSVEDSYLGLVRSDFENADARLLTEGSGGRGDRYMTFRALRRGECDLPLSLRRPWQKGGAPVRTFTIHLQIVGKPTGDADRGYLDAAKTRDLALSGAEA